MYKNLKSWHSEMLAHTGGRQCLKIGLCNKFQVFKMILINLLVHGFIVVNIMSLVSRCLHLHCRLNNERGGSFKMLVSVSQATWNHSMDDQS